jgi:hypothetical protein
VIFGNPGDALESVVPASLHRQAELPVLLDGEGGVRVLGSADAILVLGERGINLAGPVGSFAFRGAFTGDALATTFQTSFEVAIALMGLAETGPAIATFVNEEHWIVSQHDY